ncbi:MAG: LacI family DNA-binding transcriptional regulator [Verrucomicrobiota bacterium JB022]|nr:LacI family DNA-binding transcriptional regulator [Verrucomicrobiota bacterium JB022]
MPRASSKSSRLDKTGILSIAEELGVSASTVSRALRSETSHLVSSERRKEILDLAERRGFTPNPGARMLRRGVNTSLSVIVPLDESIFFSEFYGRFLAGTLRAAASRGWDVQIRTLKRGPDHDLREAMQQVSLDTSGVIYLAEPLSREELAQLKGYRRPLVLTKAALPRRIEVSDLSLPVVGVDNVEGARSAVRLLHQLGHRRLGLLLGPADSSRDAYERDMGYREAMQALALDARPDWILQGSFSFEGGRAMMERLLQGPERPTALCCASDEIAFGAITALQAAGLRCPEDISIVGFDDGLWATMARPTLTTVRQPLADLAERAVAVIVEAASATGKAKPVRSQPADLSASLVIRDSTRVA